MTTNGGKRLGRTLPHTVWKKSSYSDNLGNCVETALLPDGTAVRDSKNPSGPVLHFSAPVWQAFLSRAKAGLLDLE
ncbi:MAG TPA: DUF397 domain-containing protein [Pseudonocardiaceae bacterium]